ncbi:hypothetical protein NAI54_10520, partial [Francisella tularensis subsp. holarctica]|uniref:hypothetical protein n=1 Tax=Francisella tularensis TaxID=263 RepID=UPI002381A7C3
NIYFIHKAVPGAAKKSYGIQVATLAGISQDVLESAKQNVYNLEKKQQLTDSTQVQSLFELVPTTHYPLQQQLDAIDINTI